ncbi:MAG: histone deacetylase [Deltaproteobacteria bacterium]|nr:histone deacetylase [Deltaproteobacteria bacterium]
MLRTGLVVDARYQDHYTGRNHPERPTRISTLLTLVEDYHRPGMKHLAPRSATPEEIALIHDSTHIGRVAATAEKNYFAFDADTPVSSQSYATALLATGGLLTLLEAIMTREVDNGFALVRPPGHHAERNRAMGFCLFNSAAIGAQYLREKFGLQRIVVMDWDVHHGNGTQHSFYDDPGILYVSTHQYPYYPGTGAAEEVGQGQGEGYTVNLPIPAGWGNEEYQELFQGVIDPICRQFDPQFVLISAGFDAHSRDPLGGMEVTEAGFGTMARILLRIARDHAHGRCAAILEGGYDLKGLQKSVVQVLDEMAGDTLVNALPQLEPRALLPRIKAVQRQYWELPKD